MEKICFRTLGCKVNQYETQGIREGFLKRGYREVEGAADIYIINTCTVTEAADREARALIRGCRKENPDAKVVVTGCYAQKDEKEILAMGGITHLVKSHDKARIPEIVEEQPPTGEPIYESRRPVGKVPFLPLQISDFKDHTRAFVKIQDGCDYRCAFCKVWSVRGRSVSRSPSEIVAEVGRLVSRGFREVVLTGVSLGLYGRDFEGSPDLMDIVHRLEAIPDLGRIRLSSIDPIDVGEAFIEKLFLSRKCCRHLHLSLQSGDDGVLSRMRRNYTSGDYRSLVQKLRKKDPCFSITTDIIVGFPGETEAQFEKSLEIIRELKFTRVHLFPYSHRKGTEAYRFKDLVSPETIRSRMARTKKASQEASFRYRRSLIGKEATVLAESLEANGLVAGYTEHYVRVLFNGRREHLGQMVPVRLQEETKSQ